MKTCPTCNKTFDDSLKFCQVDGTPLVAETKEEEPLDPYKTMVATPMDIPIPPEKIKEKPKGDSKKSEEVKKSEEPKESFDPYKTMVAGKPTKIEKNDPPSASDKDIDEDLMKTMVAGNPTSENVKVDIPAEKKKEDKKEESSATPPPSPFDKPKPVESKKKEVSGAPKPKASEVNKPPISVKNPAEDKPSIPIPSPFDKSMPPGFAPPSTPPFDPTEPVKAEKVASASTPVVEPKVEDKKPKDWSPPAAPVEEWKNKEIGEKTPFDSPPATDGQDNILAIVSLVCGILSMTLCCWFGILLGPAGLITGFIARRKINEDPNAYGGGTFALVGMITGGIGTIIFFALVILQIASGVISNSF